MAHKVDDAGLHGGVRIGGVDRFRKAFVAVHHGNQDVFQPAFFEVIHDGKLTLCPFIGRNPPA